MDCQFQVCKRADCIYEMGLDDAKLQHYFQNFQGISAKYCTYLAQYATISQ